MSFAQVRTNFETSRAPQGDVPVCLIVDDSLIDRYMIAHVLREAVGDVDIRECATFDQARDTCAAGWPDILIVDRMLPDGDGSALLTAVPEDCTAILMSGESHLDSEEEPRFLHKDDLCPVALAQHLSRWKRDPDIVLSLNQRSGPATIRIATRGMLPPLSRALRLLRTARARRHRSGPDELEELLIEVEDILAKLQERLDRAGR